MLRHLSIVQNPSAPLAEELPRIPAGDRAVPNRAAIRKEDGLSDRLLIRLQDLPLPARVHECLARLGLERLGDLVSLSPETLLEQRNFGHTSLRALNRVLARLGLALGMSVEGWPPSNLTALSRERAQATGEAVRRVFIPRDEGRLEDELRQLAGPAGSLRNVSVVVRHLGWDGRGGATLESVGREHRISRQRALQIVKRVRRQYQRANVLPPHLERCLIAATPRIAEKADVVEERLQRAGETNSRFRLEGLVTAAETLRIQAPIEVFFLGAERLVARRGTRAYLPSIIRRARKIVESRGAACLRDVLHSFDHEYEAADLVGLLLLEPGFEWLEDSKSWFWFHPAFAPVPRKTENRLVNRIMKRLWLARPMHVAELWGRLSRSSRGAGESPPKSALLGICRQIPWCSVQGETIGLLERHVWIRGGIRSQGPRPLL
jgi:hypothetical protein